MSRAYRIKVRESMSRVIRGRDHVSTGLEILSILPADEMAGLLAQELVKRGFEKQEGKLVREEAGVVVTVDPATGNVTVAVEATEAVTVEGEREGYARDQGGKHARQTQKQLSEQLKEDLKKQTGQKQEELQSKVTDRLERSLGEIRTELDQAVNEVTRTALKQKASRMGQIKEVTEDPQAGTMTIVLEV